MKVKNYEGRTIVADMIEACRKAVGRDVAVKAIREVCRYFGGQLVYIPMRKTTGNTTAELHGVLRDAAGDPGADRMLEKLMVLFGGYQVYIPMEKGAFRDAIAREIYKKYDGTNKTTGDLCREYGISFNTLYRLYYRGRDNETQILFEFAEKEK